ncbi:hypothetical protein H0H81_002264 [Sphagnurus paluster]|uniref:DUF6589 domain-containing protein n=1 Tax=Sphagnurus paluster TaxID=117069 RepID=A0A9P7FPG2_9AGAR|nr:hypothetical protein H0H81_002264 [Sphagnurus paluster]
MAKTANCPTPKNLKKVEFYDSAQLINLALDTNILNCWENYFETDDDLEAFFAQKKQANALPEFHELLDIAKKLARRHATTKAFRAAHNPNDKNPDPVPNGSPWLPPTQPLAVPQENWAENIAPIRVMDDQKSNALPDMFENSQTRTSPLGDVTLANTTLFIRDAIWWHEMCRAVAEGDTGRVWEILKIWIFTFAGSGNPYYSQYLLELFCNFKWEFDDATKQSIMSNWLVCLHELGEYIEMDLMQERHNHFFEKHAQHIGKEFNDPFFRTILGMNVHHFTHLKDEMEEAVSLKCRTKNHSAADLLNEIKALLKLLREKEVNRFRAGRNEGFTADDNFEKGYKIIIEKIKRFLERTTAFANILGEHQAGNTPTMVIDTEDAWAIGQQDQDEAPRNSRTMSPPWMHIIDDEFYMVGSEFYIK